MTNFLRKIRVLWRAWKMAKMSGGSKIAIIVGILYILSPIDIIPEVVPLLGILDDIGVIPLVITIAYHLLPKDLTQGSKENVIDVEVKRP